MMKKFAVTAAVLLCCAEPVWAGEWSYEVMGKAKMLYGYSDIDARYSKNQSRHHLPSRFNANFMTQYSFDSGYQLGLYLDLQYGIDQKIKDYNQGSWGEQIYAVADSPYGRVIVGQSYNAAYQLAVGAPDAGVLGVNQSDAANFITNPNWQRSRRVASYRTLNSTDINTDGTAAKVTYITPEINNTMLGFSFVPDSYSRDGLINKHSSYRNKEGYIASLYHSEEVADVTISASLGAAHFEDIDNEISAGLSLYYRGWTLGGGYRQTFVSHKDADMNAPIRTGGEFFDGFRDAYAYNIGLGYEIGPFKTALTYFYSKADDRGYKDKIIQFSGRYQYDKYLEFYGAVAHGEFDGSDRKNSNQGYAFITGAGVKF